MPQEHDDTHLLREEGTTPLGTRKAVLVSRPPLFITVRLAGGVGILEVEQLVEEEEEEEGRGWLEVVMMVVPEEVMVEVMVEVTVEVVVLVVLVERGAGGVPPSLSLASLTSRVPCCCCPRASPGGRWGESGEPSEEELYCWRLMVVSSMARSLR